MIGLKKVRRARRLNQQKVANDLNISRLVIDIKAVIEKIREMVQNVE